MWVEFIPQTTPFAPARPKRAAGGGGAMPQSPSPSLSPCPLTAAPQLGIPVASLGLGWVGEPALGRLLQPLVDLFPGQLESQVSHGLSAGLAFALITFLHVVVGELAPKSIALQNPVRTSLVVAQPTVLTEWLFKPAIWAVDGAGNALMRLIGIKPAGG